MTPEEREKKLRQLEFHKQAGEQAYDDLYEKAHSASAASVAFSRRASGTGSDIAGAAAKATPHSICSSGYLRQRQSLAPHGQRQKRAAVCR
jgi:hypothetical protein